MKKALLELDGRQLTSEQAALRVRDLFGAQLRQQGAVGQGAQGGEPDPDRGVGSQRPDKRADPSGAHARPTASYGVTHPSLPNYLALTGGDTFGVTSDCTTCFVSAPNLVDQLETAGKSWKAYMEGMPKPCFLGNQGLLYAQKHNPFIYYDDVRTDPARCDKIVPFTSFADDLAANALPNFIWITPNQCDDIHSCADQQGDAWLKTWVPQIIASPAWVQGGALFITFDEGTSNAGGCGNAAGGHVATLVISPLGAPASESATPIDHYALLRTIEDAWGMPHLGAAASATPMTDFFPTSATPATT